MPTWLDYLLSEEDANFKGMCLSQLTSDSITLLDSIVDLFSSFSFYNNEVALGGNETCKGNVTFPKNAITLALSDYAF